MAVKEVRVRQLPDRFVDGRWQTKPQPIVRLGDVGKWSMVRVAHYPNAAPFVISRKDWDALPASVDTLPKGRDSLPGSVGTKGSAVPKADAQPSSPPPPVNKDEGR